MSRRMNLYLCGVGGQGVGLLAEWLARACLAAGRSVYGCDTHGLAQRHGTVVSHLRLDQDPCTPRIPPGEADLVVALERLEAYRAAGRMLAPGGTLFYYDAVYQPIVVRLGEERYPTPEQLVQLVSARGGRVRRVLDPGLSDPRMQNMAVLGRLAAENAIEAVTLDLVRAILPEMVPAGVLEPNRAVLERAASWNAPRGAG